MSGAFGELNRDPGISPGLAVECHRTLSGEVQAFSTLLQHPRAVLSFWFVSDASFGISIVSTQLSSFFNSSDIYSKNPHIRNLLLQNRLASFLRKHQISISRLKSFLQLQLRN